MKMWILILIDNANPLFRLKIETSETKFFIKILIINNLAKQPGTSWNKVHFEQPIQPTEYKPINSLLIY